MATPWRTAGSFPDARYNYGAATLSSGIPYVVGGRLASGTTKTGYYLAALGWFPIPDYPSVAREGLLVVASGNDLYAIGGRAGSGGFTSVVERYRDGVWTTMAPMPSARGFMSGAVVSGSIVVAGGYAGTDASISSQVLLYDLAAGTWSVSGTSSLGPRYAQAFADDGAGRLYVAGGLDLTAASAVGSPGVWFRAATGAWTALPNMPTARTGAAATVSNGKLYVSGGRATNSDASAPLTVTEVLDLTANTWTTDDPMPTGRVGIQFTPRARSRYVVGGYIAGSTITSDVVYLSPQLPPNAPPLNAPVGGASIDRAIVQRFTFGFSDPDEGDSASGYNLLYRLVGAAAFTLVSGSTPNLFRDFAAGFFAAGNYEWQVRSSDQAGVFGPYSASAFFTAADLPAGPTFLDPINGQAIASSVYTAQFSYATANSFDYVVDNGAGAVYASGSLTSTQRSFNVTGLPNGGTVVFKVRAVVNGLAGPYSTVSTTVSFTPPAIPALTLSASKVAVTSAWSQPVPSGAQPTVSYVDVYRRETLVGGAGIRLATMLPTASAFIDAGVASGVQYEYRVVAFGANGTSTSSAWTS